MAQPAVIEGEVSGPKSVAKRKIEALPAKATEGMGVIERLVMGGASIETIERVIAMNERQEDRQAQTAFNASIARAQAALIPVSRNRRNDQTSSNYADLSAIVAEAMPIIHGEGFGLSFSEFKSDRENCMGVACKVSHSAGYSERYEFHIPLDSTGLRGNANKTPTHAYGSTFSYGRRYATCGVFNIATRDDNDGNNGPGRKQPEKPVERITEQQRAELDALIERTPNPEMTARATLGHFKAEKLEDLTVSQYVHTKEQLKKRFGIK